MKLAIQIGYDELFEKKCRFAHEGGFKAIAVNYTKVLGKTEYEWEKITEDIQRILDENKLECVQSHPYYYDLLVSSELMQDEYEFAIKQAIKSSGQLGAKWCALHPRSSITSGFATSVSFRDNKKAFSDYLEYAHKYNTGLAAENLPIFPGLIPAMPFYSYNYDDLIDFVDSFNDDRVGICWDFGHAFLVNVDMGVAIRAMGNRLKCTHVHNNHRKDDTHNTPEQGYIEWDVPMKALSEIGYNGPLTAEVHCPHNDDDLLKSFARHNYCCLAYLEKLTKQV